jgi:hypothetical protein
MRTLPQTLGLLLALTGAAAAQTDSVAAPRDSVPEAGWAPDPSRLFEAPTGRTLPRGELFVGASASTPFSPLGRVGPIPRLTAAYGVTSRVALRGGFQGSPDHRTEDGRVLVGAELGMGSDSAPLALRGEVDFPLDHVYGRRMGNVVLQGARQFGTPERALVVGAGWQGYRGLCRPEWTGCRSDWHGSTFGLVGGIVPLGPNAQFVTENRLRIESITTTTGARFGVGRVTAGVAVRGLASALFGGGVRFDGLLLSASYRTPLRQR